MNHLINYEEHEKTPLEALDILLHLDDYNSPDRKEYMKELGKIIEKALLNT